MKEPSKRCAAVAVSFVLMPAMLNAQEIPKLAHGSAPIPHDVAQFVTPGTVVLTVRKGDVDGDGVPDYLLVLQNPSGLNERELLVLIRRKNGQLKLAASNKTILGCPIMQGEGGGIRLKPTGSGFEVEDDVGSGLVSDAKHFKFKYIRPEHAWVLIELEEDTYDGTRTPPEHARHFQRPYERGSIVRFAEFNGDNYGVSCSP